MTAPPFDESPHPMTTPRTGGGVYRTLATIPHRTPTWLRLAAWLVEIPALHQASEWRWYRRAIGGHWERIEGWTLPGMPSCWERIEHCRGENSWASPYGSIRVRECEEHS